jgi:son of sevenless-like protein
MAQVVDIEDMFDASGGGLEANIWDETLKNGQVRELNPEEVRKRGTLNELVEILCSDTRIDNTLMRTFLTTYRAFTTPTELFEKLVQRWHCPPVVPSDRARAIQLRVGITLKYWIEHQSRDFDAELRSRIAQFLDKTVIPNQAQHALGKMLKNILDKQALEAELKGQFEYTLERVTRVESSGRTLFQYWLALEDVEIARQMTLIEYRLFSQISPSELLNQSWNKKKLQYRAPNVRALIERANRVVNWTGNMIAWGQNKKERAATFSKFIRICEELSRLNNFNTLMATISAMNSASIKRLAASKGLVSPALMASFKRMDDLLQSTGSYKQYRELLHSVSPPLLPYMGVYLTDLTFIEDATPDMFDNKINFQKRIQAEEILLEVEQYQQTRYGFPIVEPIHTFLYELPISSDNDLYNLSTAREPRNVNPDEIQ